MVFKKKIIKPVANGSAVAVIDRDYYVSVAERQLGDSTYYRLRTRVLSMKCKMNKNYLHVDQPKAGRFYIPKADNPGGPVVSANNHPMEKITELWICICNFR